MATTTTTPAAAAAPAPAAAAVPAPAAAAAAPAPAAGAAAKTIAFFGATGGCTNAALVLALEGGYFCSALARTPHKLREMLAEKGVSETTMAAQLVIVRGDARDVHAQRAVLAPVGGLDYTDAGAGGEQDATTTTGTAAAAAAAAYPYDATRGPATLVVSGIGMDALSRNPDMTICQDWTRTFLDAVSVWEESKPFVAAISTTGITNGPRDVPVAFVPLYHVALKTPHEDKRVMEDLLVQAQADTALRGAVLVRPSLLFSGPEHERARIRVGSEQNPALGYTINRADIGRWIYEEIIVGDEMRWSGEKPTVTL